jgi:MerR family transcriptional regulator/heat shock protein HspR
MYSMADIDRLRRLKALTEDMGLNLAGAEVALKLMNRIEELEGEVEQLTEAVKILQGQGQRQRPPDASGTSRSNPTSRTPRPIN